ncbi:MAG: phage tail tape measure protein [Prevotellaceae bacterium]|jgi:hypothetical protein|nr:phage tail tape measure protein [Prevotellaceae bacterium]
MTQDKAIKLAFLLQATDHMSKTFEIAGKNLTGFQKRMTEVGASAARMGGFFMTMGNQIAGGMLNIAKAAGDYADTSVTNATKVGMQTAEWQKLAYAADMAGISQEKLTSGMSKFNDAIKKAAAGTGTSFFKDMGIQLKDANGKMRDQQDILADVADVFAKTGNNAAKSLAAKDIFGEGGTDFIKMLNTGSEGLEKMGKKAEDLGLANDKNTEASLKFTEALREIGSAILSLKVSIGSAMAPMLTALAKAFTWMVELASWITQKCPLATKIIAGIVAGIGALMFVLGALSVTFGAIVLTFNRVVKAWRFATIAVRGVWNGILYLNRVLKISQFLTETLRSRLFWMKVYYSLLSIWAKIAAAAQWLWNGAVTAGRAVVNFFTSGIILAGIKLGALAVWHGVSAAAQWLWNGAVTAGRAVVNFFSGGIIASKIALVALAVWQGISTAAQWLFNAALYACPVVWIIAAILAVIAVVVLLVAYWDDIVAFFENIWEGIKNAFSAAWNWFLSLPEKFAQFGRNIIQGLINGITGALSGLWNIIKNLVVNKIGKFFANLLGIHSPSTMFAKFGLNITQGLVVGVDKGEDAVGNATGGLAEQALTGYEQGLQAQTVPVGGAGGGFGMAGSFNYSPTISIGAGVSEGTKQDFAQLLRAHYMEIVNIMQRFSENKTRLSYS